MSSLEKVKRKYNVKLLMLNDKECQLQVPKDVFNNFQQITINYTSNNSGVIISLDSFKKNISCPKEYHNILVRASIASVLNSRGISIGLLSIIDENGNKKDKIDWNITEESEELANRIKASNSEERKKIFKEYVFLKDLGGKE